MVEVLKAGRGGCRSVGAVLGCWWVGVVVCSGRLVGCEMVWYGAGEFCFGRRRGFPRPGWKVFLNSSRCLGLGLNGARGAYFVWGAFGCLIGAVVNCGGGAGVFYESLKNRRGAVGAAVNASISSNDGAVVGPGRCFGGCVSVRGAVKAGRKVDIES